METNKYANRIHCSMFAKRSAQRHVRVKLSFCWHIKWSCFGSICIVTVQSPGTDGLFRMYQEMIKPSVGIW